MAAAPRSTITGPGVETMCAVWGFFTWGMFAEWVCMFADDAFAEAVDCWAAAAGLEVGSSDLLWLLAPVTVGFVLRLWVDLELIGPPEELELCPESALMFDDDDDRLENLESDAWTPGAPRLASKKALRVGSSRRFAAVEGCCPRLEPPFLKLETLEAEDKVWELASEAAEMSGVEDRGLVVKLSQLFAVFAGMNVGTEVRSLETAALTLPIDLEPSSFELYIGRLDVGARNFEAVSLGGSAGGFSKLPDVGSCRLPKPNWAVSLPSWEGGFNAEGLLVLLLEVAMLSSCFTEVDFARRRWRRRNRRETRLEEGERWTSSTVDTYETVAVVWKSKVEVQIGALLVVVVSVVAAAVAERQMMSDSSTPIKENDKNVSNALLCFTNKKLYLLSRSSGTSLSFFTTLISLLHASTSRLGFSLRRQTALRRCDSKREALRRLPFEDWRGLMWSLPGLFKGEVRGLLKLTLRGRRSAREGAVAGVCCWGSSGDKATAANGRGAGVRRLDSTLACALNGWREAVWLGADLESRSCESVSSSRVKNVSAGEGKGDDGGKEEGNWDGRKGARKRGAEAEGDRLWLAAE